MKKFILFFFLILIVNYAATAQNWTIGPFVKSKANPVISPDSSFKFYDPIKKDSVQWQKEYFVNLAWSDNLYEWNPIEENNELKHVMDPRPGKFDSRLTECGPPAIITKNGILLLYNGKNAADSIADFSLPKGVYSIGEALFDINDPGRLLDRTDTCILKPTRPDEISVQYAAGTTFAEGLVYFKEHWFLYYGMADSFVGLAVTSK